jgi:hypothetical protein
MKKNITIITIAIVAATILTSCASVKDKQGNVIGKCFGLSCAVRGIFDYNHIDSETGLLEGTFAIGPTPVQAARAAAARKASAVVAAVSAPVETNACGEASTQQTSQQ